MLALVTLFRNVHVVQTIQEWMGTDAGYAVLFGLLLSCGMGLPLPEDIPLLLGGFCVADGKMNLALAAMFAWCGIIGGDCILYYLGRRFGLNITKVPVIGHHINKDRIGWVHEKFEKYGLWVVAVGRLFAGIRGAMVLTAGTIRFNFIKFLIADGFAAVVSGGLFMALGMYARHRFGNLKEIEESVAKYKRIVTVVVFAVVIAYAGWQWWKAARKKKKQELQQKFEEPNLEPSNE
jgi:membrane protein DedA with SNARE-associated domain